MIFSTITSISGRRIGVFYKVRLSLVPRGKGNGINCWLIAARTRACILQRVETQTSCYFPNAYHLGSSSRSTNRQRLIVRK
jgi:hypothetical protein